MILLTTSLNGDPKVKSNYEARLKTSYHTWNTPTLEKSLKFDSHLASQIPAQARMKPGFHKWQTEQTLGQLQPVFAASTWGQPKTRLPRESSVMPVWTSSFWCRLLRCWRCYKLAILTCLPNIFTRLSWRNEQLQISWARFHEVVCFLID
jgi:hypothetical protein